MTVVHWHHGGKFSDSKTSVRKFTSPVEKILTKFPEIFSALKKPLFIDHRKTAIFGTFFVSRISDQSGTDKHRRWIRETAPFSVFILPTFFVSYDNSEKTVQSARENNIPAIMVATGCLS